MSFLIATAEAEGIKRDSDTEKIFARSDLSYVSHIHNQHHPTLIYVKFMLFSSKPDS